MSLQSRLQELDEQPPAKEPSLTDPVAFLRRLVSSGRFHKDTGLGRIYHPGSVSLRENARVDSLHIVVHEDHISVASHTWCKKPTDAGSLMIILRGG